MNLVEADNFSPQNPIEGIDDSPTYSVQLLRLVKHIYHPMLESLTPYLSVTCRLEKDCLVAGVVNFS